LRFSGLQILTLRFWIACRAFNLDFESRREVADMVVVLITVIDLFNIGCRFR
jgi:hypothetical protein